MTAMIAQSLPDSQGVGVAGDGCLSVEDEFFPQCIQVATTPSTQSIVARLTKRRNTTNKEEEMKAASRIE